MARMEGQLDSAEGPQCRASVIGRVERGKGSGVQALVKLHARSCVSGVGVGELMCLTLLVSLHGASEGVW